MLISIVQEVQMPSNNDMQFNTSIVAKPSFKGFSTYFSVGRKKGWCIQRDGPSIRINLGWISLAFLSIDVENLLKGLLEELQSNDISKKAIEEKERSINQSLVELENQKGLAKSELRAIEMRHEFDKKKQMELERTLSEVISQRDVYKVTIDNMEMKDAEISDLNDEIAELSNTNDSLESEIDVLKTKVAHSQKQEIDLLAQILGLDKEINALEATIYCLRLESEASNFF